MISRWVDFSTCPQHLKTLYRELNRAQSGNQSRWLQYHVAVSRTYPWTTPGNGKNSITGTTRKEVWWSLQFIRSSTWVYWWFYPFDGFLQYFLRQTTLFLSWSIFFQGILVDIIYLNHYTLAYIFILYR